MRTVVYKNKRVLCRVKIVDHWNGQRVYFDSPDSKALNAYKLYDEECESDWFPLIRAYYYGLEDRKPIGFRDIEYSGLIDLCRNSLPYSPAIAQ